jgi:S-adenosylmethionine/arginine decarboxylase-like enzyme
VTAPEPFGLHLILDLAECDPIAVRDGEVLKRLVLGLCEAIGMEPYGPPWAERFALDNPKAAGYTVMQPITTSLISLHASESRDSVCLDVFSCRDFDVEMATEYAVKALGAGKVAQRQVLTRY